MVDNRDVGLQNPNHLQPSCGFSRESLKKTEAPDMATRYCSPYSAPNKAGRLNEGKRKEIQEERKPTRKKGTLKEATYDWKRKDDRDSTGKRME